MFGRIMNLFRSTPPPKQPTTAQLVTDLCRGVEVLCESFAARDIDAYQREAVATAIYGPVSHPSVPNLLMAFRSMGAIAERAKKTFRDRGGVFTDEDYDIFDQYFDDIDTQALGIGSCYGSDPIEGHRAIYPVFGLMGESGEVAEKVLRLIVNNPNELTEEDRIEIAKEVADCLWYIAALSQELGFTLSQVAKLGLDKTKSRRERGKIQGSGDNR